MVGTLIQPIGLPEPTRRAEANGGVRGNPLGIMFEVQAQSLSRGAIVPKTRQAAWRRVP